MDWIPLLSAFLAGTALGLLLAFALGVLQGRTAETLAERLFHASEEQRKADTEAVLTHLKSSFGSLSLDALNRSSEAFLRLAKARLDAERETSIRDLEAKKGLIDGQLKRMSGELEHLDGLMRGLEADRAEKFGELATQLKLARDQTAALVQTTAALREALASSKARGQWGERMAEDVLRMVGFLENVNYLKQKSLQGIGTRPDFTFMLPKDLTLNMDVKFPLDNYLKYLEADSDLERGAFRDRFLRDVRLRIKEVATREYINPEQNTVDCVLLFIPSEQVFAFIHEQIPALLDEGLKDRVILCSPMTLFSVLVVIRQAVESFALQRTSHEIVNLLSEFRKQWAHFVKKMDLLGKRISDAQAEYESLLTTRRRQLEGILNRVEDLKKQQTPLPSDGPADAPPAQDADRNPPGKVPGETS
jgi:DNA recombination protein RmuC